MGDGNWMVWRKIVSSPPSSLKGRVTNAKAGKTEGSRTKGKG